MYGFSFNGNKAVRGVLLKLHEDLEPQTVVIENDSRLGTMTLQITTIITAIITTAALHGCKVLR